MPESATWSPAQGLPCRVPGTSWPARIEAVLRYTVTTTLLFGRAAVIMHVILQLYRNTAKQEFSLLHLIQVMPHLSLPTVELGCLCIDGLAGLPPLVAP